MGQGSRAAASTTEPDPQTPGEGHPPEPGADPPPLETDPPAPAVLGERRTWRALSALPDGPRRKIAAGELFLAADGDPRARFPHAVLVEDGEQVPAEVAEALAKLAPTGGPVSDEELAVQQVAPRRVSDRPQA